MKVLLIKEEVGVVVEDVVPAVEIMKALINSKKRKDNWEFNIQWLQIDSKSKRRGSNSNSKCSNKDSKKEQSKHLKNLLIETYVLESSTQVDREKLLEWIAADNQTIIQWIHQLHQVWAFQGLSQSWVTRRKRKNYHLERRTPQRRDLIRKIVRIMMRASIH